MARKYEYVPGRNAWNLKKCEEELLIAGYEEICHFIQPDERWKAAFENHFFGRGNGVAFDFLDSINTVRRRQGLEVIVIRETYIYDYGRSPDNLLKSNHRRQVREELKQESGHILQNRIERAKAEAERLPPYIEGRRQQRAELPVARAAKMLTLASPDLRGEIITKLSPEGALEVAEMIEDGELRDALVRHSLDAP
jgi:hypothetical protein